MLFPDLSHLQLKPLFEVRGRYERRVDRDLNRSVSDNRSDLLSRFRAGVAFGQGKTQGQVVYQYAHDELWTVPGNLAQWRSDILLAFVTTPVEKGTATLGRQRFNIGTARLLGSAEFNNVTIGWDGARFAMGRLDLFGGKSGINPFPNQELSIYGGLYTEGPAQTLAVFKHDGRGAGVDETTVSQQYRSTQGHWKIDAEAAVQFGHRGGRKKLAGAADAQVVYAATSKISVGAQASIASGGGDGDTTHSFDQLYPSGHDKHGIIDSTGWQNVRDLGLWVSYAPDRVTTVKLQYHGLGLDSARDAWYGVFGAVNGGYNDPTGSHGRDLGDEFDLGFDRKLNAHQVLNAGLGVLVPGKYIRSFPGDARDQVYGFVQWQYKF